MLAAATVLLGIRRQPNQSLARFRERFLVRYEGAEVPLLEALDPETGLGFDDDGAVAEPLVDGLDLPRPDAKFEWTSSDRALLKRLTAALQSGAPEIELDDELYKALGGGIAAEALPPSGAAFVRVAHTSAGRRILLEGVTGAPGARLLGRFCHADAQLEQLVRAHCQDEQALYPGAILAEIVHLPEGRLGNIMARPVLRDHEIVFLGRSGAKSTQQIPIGDLTVAVRGTRVVLRSRELDREVVPRFCLAAQRSPMPRREMTGSCVLGEHGTQ